MAISLPPVQPLLVPTFFIRSPLGFRLLCRTLELHLVNRISEETVLNVTVPQADCEDPLLLERIWFLLFLGATATGIEYNVRRYRDEIRSRPSSGSHISPGRARIHEKPETTALGHGKSISDQSILPSASARLQVASANNSINPGFNSHGFPNSNTSSAYNTRCAALDDVRIPYGATKSLPQNHRNPTQKASSLQGKKGFGVESYFRDRKFSGSPEQSIENRIRDFEICAVQQSLDQQQMSLFFINALADPARQIFLTHCSSRMDHSQIIIIRCRHYNS